MKRPRSKFRFPELIVFIHEPTASLIVANWSKTFELWWVDAGKQKLRPGSGSGYMPPHEFIRLGKL